MRRIVALVLLICCLSPAWAASTAVKVYSLHHQLAESLLPAIESVLLADESVKAFNNELVVNASADSHRQVEQLLQALDAPLRNLLISVRNAGSGAGSSNSTGVSGGIRTGDVYLGTGGPVYRERQPDGGLVIRHDGLQVHSSRGTRNTDTAQAQALRTIEGYPAWISAGQTLAYRSVDRWGNPVTGFQDANRGFYVTARIIGQRVQLDISTSNDRPTENPRERRRGVIETERLQTTVTGAIGEWIPLGNISLQDNRQDSGYTGRSNQSAETVSDISVMVVPAD